MFIKLYLFFQTLQHTIILTVAMANKSFYRILKNNIYFSNSVKLKKIEGIISVLKVLKIIKS